MITTNTIALILRSLGAAVQMPGVFGNAAARLAPLLNTIASFAELPEKTRAHQEALLRREGPTQASARIVVLELGALDVGVG